MAAMESAPCQARFPEASDSPSLAVADASDGYTLATVGGLSGSAKKTRNRHKCLFLLDLTVSSGGRIRTSDFRVMSPASLVFAGIALTGTYAHPVLTQGLSQIHMCNMHCMLITDFAIFCYGAEPTTPVTILPSSEAI